MVKRTLYFGNPVYLKKENDQLKGEIVEDAGDEKEISVPIEDIGFIILDNYRITVTQPLLTSLLENNTAVVTCGPNHMPLGLFLPLESNTLQNERFRSQIDASEPLKKQLWQQTVKSKIFNQAELLKSEGIKTQKLRRMIQKVLSGDSDNLEGQAASFYWKNFFNQFFQFTREREGDPPNNLLNYGYAVLRAITARSLVASGLLPTLGIHHSNKYNAYCLADDIMEPYRPWVDAIVLEIIKNGEDFETMNKSVKEQLLALPYKTTIINEQKSPLMVAMSKTTASLAKCFEGKKRKIIYPEFSYEHFRV